jgi:tRNA threonylcarbamoyladenosine biosynthesis protein TsaE
MTEFVTHSEQETEDVGRHLAAGLGAGDTLLLSGPLGAGKTALTRGLARGLGCDPTAVSSPTFTLVQEYAGPVRLQHVDLYRLADDEVDDLALDDLLVDSVMAVEWPERWRRAPADAILVTIEPSNETTRRIRVRLPGRMPPTGQPGYRDSTR